MATAYRSTVDQLQEIEKHPRISGKWALDKNLWEGRRVAVRFMRARGNHRRATDMRIMYGTLVLNPTEGRTDQIGVRDASGEVHAIHASRAKDIYDLTREKGAK